MLPRHALLLLGEVQRLQLVRDLLQRLVLLDVPLLRLLDHLLHHRDEGLLAELGAPDVAVLRLQLVDVQVLLRPDLARHFKEIHGAVARQGQRKRLVQQLHHLLLGLQYVRGVKLLHRVLGHHEAEARVQQLEFVGRVAPLHFRRQPLPDLLQPVHHALVRAVLRRQRDAAVEHGEQRGVDQLHVLLHQHLKLVGALCRVHQLQDVPAHVLILVLGQVRQRVVPPDLLLHLVVPLARLLRRRLPSHLLPQHLVGAQVLLLRRCHRLRMPLLRPRLRPALLAVVVRLHRELHRPLGVGLEHATHFLHIDQPLELLLQVLHRPLVKEVRSWPKVAAELLRDGVHVQPPDLRRQLLHVAATLRPARAGRLRA
mmetsp:Transcript_30825/g.79167  ORF Transcript_30825/g.79167 Transcript_30825/m.79167 type:complete len:369 (-) Transcript_30825:33-1139(-)